MKTNNQTEQSMLELAANSAANEDGFSPRDARDATLDTGKHAWSPYEVWRTRMKAAERGPSDPAQI
jgi:hypothetical protein